MYQTEIKTEIKNNIIMTMANYLSHDVVEALEQTIISEFVTVNMEKITTLPVAYQNSTDEENKRIISLYIYQRRNLSPKTIEGYLRAVKKLILLIDKPLSSMDENDISYYLQWYENRNTFQGGRKNQASTINNERRFLSAFFDWMRKAKMIADNPVENTRPKKVIRKPIDYFNRFEVEALREGCYTLRERAIVEVFRSTGGRVGELVEVMQDMIDWTTGDILIKSEKSDRYRTIYLDEEARYHLKKYLSERNDDNPALFVHERAPHSTLQPCGIRVVMKEIAKRAGVTCRVYPHKMRKTLGMELKNKGVDIGSIQEILGHANPSVTAEYYAQSTPQTLRNIRERAA